MAKPQVSLPASYGGLMRYDEALGDLKFEPGHVVALVGVVSIILILLNIFG